MSESLIHPLARCCWCNAAFVRGKVLDTEVWLCPNQPCYSRQAKHAMIVTVKGRPRSDAPAGGNKRCRFVPLPRQVEAEEAIAGTATYVLIGGAAGGSKSKGCREIAHKRGMTIPHYRILLLRRTYAQLEENHLRDVELEAPEMGAQFVPSAKLVRYPNGSTLRFGHCETVADAANYLSSEYDLIIFDELVTFEEAQFLLISSRARSTKPGVTPKVLAGTNPGGPQSHWVRMRFIDKNVDLDDFPDYKPEDWQFIPSKLEDNPYLDSSYEKKLLALPKELRKAYRDGDWDIFPGQYFPEWRKAKHVTEEHRVFPPSAERVLSMDWGFIKPGVVGFWVLHDGHAYREEEYVFTRTIAYNVGLEIARRCKQRDLKKVKYLVYDYQMNVPDNSTGESTIETVKRGMKDGGFAVSTLEADKDRINGWQRFRHWLGIAPDGAPWMQSSPLCAYFNRTVPSLVSDDSKPEDVDTDGEDHAADDGRYFFMSRPAPSKPVEVKTVVPGSPADIMRRLRQKAGRTFGRVA